MKKKMRFEKVREETEYNGLIIGGTISILVTIYGLCITIIGGILVNGLLFAVILGAPLIGLIIDILTRKTIYEEI